MKVYDNANFILRSIIILAIFFSNVFLYSQNIIGKVTDSLNRPLENANILAIPIDVEQDLKFAISKDDGSYKLYLVKNQSYEITVSYLGYLSQKINFTPTNSNLVKNFILKENPNQLEEINIEYKPPIIVKKDTTIYDVSRFTKGTERKLRDALKKLPGVEVDRAGNVKVNGKKVNKVLVENKTFFTGDSKLAVNNIPADAVDKVEILDNYNEVAMLKGLQDSENMAMNIKLKEDKKKFIFGDIEAGGGYEDRYFIHPSLFYYSPKTSLSFIGDINNIGQTSFTLKDYINFQGGVKTLLDKSDSFMSSDNSFLYSFINDQNFLSNTNQFGALNINQSINNLTSVSGYIITSISKTETASETLNIYQNIDDPFTENRTVTNSLNNFFTIGKITLDYDPSAKEDFAYNSFVKVTNNNSNGLINTVNPNQNNSINTLTDVTSLNLKQNVNYSRKLSKAHTATLEATYNFQNDKPITEWLTNQRILQGLIPLEDDTVFNILQTKRSNSHNFSAIIKDYWVLNNFNHIYTSVGINTSFNDFFNQDEQLLSDGTSNNFNSAGFGNDFGYGFLNTFLGLEYKFQIGKAIFKPGLFYNGYLWRTQQFDVAESFNKSLLLPQMTTKVELSNSKKINFRYRLNARFPGINQLANNFVLSNFNSVFRGNNQLENQLYHTASLSYYRFGLFEDLNFNINTSFNKRITTIKNVTELNGIESFNTAIMFDQPEHNWSLGGSISKKIKKIKYKLSSRFSYNDFFQIINNDTNLNISKSVSNTVGIETSFKKYPNLEVNYTKDFSNYKANAIDNEFENDRLEVILEYDFLKDFIFKADYTFDNYNNKSQDIINTFNTANASLFYQKEDSPWGFEINATNIFDVRFRQNNSFNAFVISDNRTFILPRIVMFKLNYKL